MHKVPHSSVDQCSHPLRSLALRMSSSVVTYAARMFLGGAPMFLNSAVPLLDNARADYEEGFPLHGNENGGIGSIKHGR